MTTPATAASAKATPPLAAPETAAPKAAQETFKFARPMSVYKERIQEQAKPGQQMQATS